PATPPEPLPKGISVNRLNRNQQDIFYRLLRAYVADNYQGDVNAERRDRILRTPPSQLHFAWLGHREPGRQHYYRIQGPDFVIEYINLDGQHVHTVWHDLPNH